MDEIVSAVRIVKLDFYMCAPIPGFDPTYSEFRGVCIAQVPVIRVFGATDTGKKMCLHIHGVFPYLYIPYDGTSDVNTFRYQIANSIDKAVNVSFGQASSHAQHIYKVALVSGIPFYGYHSKPHQFLKIYLFNPNLVRKISGLLQNEVILERLYQPHEAHIPYTLQFMIDYNLHGMSQLHFEMSALTIRTKLNRISYCELEADLRCEYIKNRHFDVIKTPGAASNPGIATLWEDERQRRRNKGDESQIESCLSLTESTQRKTTKSHDTFKQVLLDRLASTTTIPSTINTNNRIYPAETPPDTNLMDASTIDVHSSLSSNHDDELSSFNDDTLTNSFLLDQTLLDLDADEDVKKLFDILQDLGNDNSKEVAVEEDSVLSQIIHRSNRDSDDDEEEDGDLSLPLAAITTPVKEQDVRTRGDGIDRIIPQLDGNLDNDESNSSKKPDDLGMLVEGESDDESSDDTFSRNLQTNRFNQKSQLIKGHTKSKYKALPISTSASTSTVKNVEPASDISNKSKTDHKVKRKLAFVASQKMKNLLDSTRTEEIVSCKLKKVRTGTITTKLIDSEGSNSNGKDQKVRSSLSLDVDVERAVASCSHYSNVSSSSLTPDSLAPSSPSLVPDSLTPLSSSLVLDSLAPSSLVTDSLVPDSLAPSSSSLVPDSLASSFSSRLYEDQDSSSPSSSYLITPYQTSNNQNQRPNNNEFESSNESVSLYQPKLSAPCPNDVLRSLKILKIPSLAERPFYSNYKDVTGAVEVGYSLLKVVSKSVVHLDDFKSTFQGIDDSRRRQSSILNDNMKWTYSNLNNMKLSYCSSYVKLIEPLRKPPSRRKVEGWIMDSGVAIKSKFEENSRKIHHHYRPRINSNDDDDDLILTTTSLESLSPSFSGVVDENKMDDSREISGVTLNNTYGFKMTLDNYQNAKALSADHQYLTILVVELHIRTRGDFKPNPDHDSIRAIFYSILNDAPSSDRIQGVLAIESYFDADGKETDEKPPDIADSSFGSYRITYARSEQDLIDKFVELIVRGYDPDILAGYEIEMLSWGYLIDRAAILGINLTHELSRIDYRNNNMAPKQRQSDDDVTSGVNVTGRIVLDVWRLFRHEIALQSYTFENIVYHILHKRVPLFTFKQLSLWWDHKFQQSIYRHRTLTYYLLRVNAILDLLDQLDLIGRTSELARLFGIQFYEVLSRGSQFRVESMMLRMAKPLNFIAVSPSVSQRAQMKAPEFLPLILEPESKFYVDPVIVLDFQSLYPSMIIAYNYCFSTCLGRVSCLGRDEELFEFGATHLKVSRRRLKHYLKRDCLNFSPCGVAFVQSNIRDGILPRMLREILDTRLMVKNSMKQNKDNKLLKKILHNRQLGLKLIANVTYGYTAANFSGRMPSVEIADSVLSKGRETLQRAIALVERTPEWEAKVVYGDTDSLFVLCPGKSRAEAFEIGQKIADTVTHDNPKPVKLKLEKVYQPCILQTKKRYVGYMYESASQTDPVYDAKGIETVRRDGCPAVAKMLEKCLRLLFETKDVTLVKRFVLRQFDKIVGGRVNLQDLTFAREYRGASGYRPGACVPSLELARKWTRIDKRNEPRSGERVPYVIANGPPGLPLIRLVRSPRDFLHDSSLRPNALYYITKVIIPPLNRCFNLIGVDLNVWFNQMPRRQNQYLPSCSSSPSPCGSKKFTISQYFSTTNCAACGQQTQTNTDGLCVICKNQRQSTTVVLTEKMRTWEKSFSNSQLICQSCTGILGDTNCVSLDCPILYSLAQSTRDLQQETYIRQLLNNI